MRPIERELAARGLPPIPRTAWIEVDTTRLTANAEALVARLAPLEVAAVVKADGYGHGLEAAARCAVRGGMRWLCVATLSEALRLRADGYQGRVFVLYPVPASQIGTARQAGIDVSVSQPRDIAALSDAEGLAVHLEVDTSMTRGGIAADAVASAVSQIRATPTRLVGVWTHLASPEDAGATDRQIDIFRQATDFLDDEIEVRHVAASGGILAAGLVDQDMVRAGLVYYGHHPGTVEPLPDGIGAALQIKAHPVRVADVAEGTGVGYASTWRTTRPSRIATLPLGYADGWSRSLSNISEALVGGKRCPLVGRISSDSLTVDVTQVPGADEHTEVCLMGSQGAESVTADEIAGLRGTISWEVLQQLTSRLPRVYRADGDIVAIRLESSRDVDYVDAEVLAYPPGLSG